MKKLYPYRFELLLISQLLILFGALIFGASIYDRWISPFVFQLNFFVALIMLQKRKKLRNFMGFLVVITTFLLGTVFLDDDSDNTIWIIRTFIYLIFYIIVTLEVIVQVWRIKKIGLNSLMGMISGYISLGLVGFLFLSLIYAMDYESFSNIGNETMHDLLVVKERLMYFSFITLLTIGYGDIAPVSMLAQKLTILIGLSGQLYLTIITAIVVGKFLNQHGEVVEEEL
ncbi:MAG: ion channel [Flavobacteriaceae bacterium]